MLNNKLRSATGRPLSTKAEKEIGERLIILNRHQLEHGPNTAEAGSHPPLWRIRLGDLSAEEKSHLEGCGYCQPVRRLVIYRKVGLMAAAGLVALLAVRWISMYPELLGMLQASRGQRITIQTKTNVAEKPASSELSISRDDRWSSPHKVNERKQVTEHRPKVVLQQSTEIDREPIPIGLEPNAIANSVEPDKVPNGPVGGRVTWNYTREGKPVYYTAKGSEGYRDGETVEVGGRIYIMRETPLMMGTSRVWLLADSVLVASR
jgi:hypothetical protein